MRLNRCIAIIPARYASSRLPGKPLVNICGKTLIQRVWERVIQVMPPELVFIATDDERIVEEGLRIGAQTLMTDTHHPNGTTRCLQAAEMVAHQGLSFDYILNIQGDEPLLEPVQLQELADVLTNSSSEFATLVLPVIRREDLESNSEVFVAISREMKALYFSRSVIPHVRGIDPHLWFGQQTFYKHIGLYAYTPCALRRFASMDTGDLEKAEALEQLRWLEHGGEIFVGITQHDSIPVDTPEDLERVRRILEG